LKSKILVFIQFFTIVLMSLPIVFSQSHHSFIGYFIFFVGLVIGLIAIYQNPPHNINIRSDIKENCQLITTGIYGYVRHPMYLSVISMMLGILILYFSLFELILYIILLVNMLTKMFYEEHLWKCESEEYHKYSKKVKRLIPFIF